MVNILSALSALLSFISLVLIAISLATSYWARITSRTNTSLNPILENTELTNPIIRYDVEHLGLWVVCYKERTLDETSCGYVGSSCNADICWIRTSSNSNDDKKTCKKNRVSVIDNCAAYQAVRAMAIIGTIFLIIGSSLLVVSSCFSSKALIRSGAILTFLATLFLMIAFAVWTAEIYRQPGLNDIGKIGWSFILFIVAWPLAFLASLLGCFAAAREKRESDYEQASQ